MTDYKTIGTELGALLEEKQAAYGDVFSATPAIVGLLFPNGIPVAGYKDVLTIVRILDKIGRICTAAGKGDPMGEDPWRDIAGYAMLMLGGKTEKATPTLSAQWVVYLIEASGTREWAHRTTRVEADEVAERLRRSHPHATVTVERGLVEKWRMYSAED
jgi:hypothetical protein